MDNEKFYKKQRPPKSPGTPGAQAGQGWFLGLCLLVCAVLLAGASFYYYPPLWQPAYKPAATTALFAPTQHDVVNINTAPAEELETLPGIGAAKAQAVVVYRADNGPFTRVEELLNVPGIGPKTLENLLEYISLS